MLQNATILIPTHNRSKYLRRIMDYYSNFKVNILVCDSSSEPYAQKMDKNVKYEHYKNYSYFKKMHNCIKKIKTPYTILCADDDFVIPESVKKCVEFMKKNSEYVSVEGECEPFLNFNKKIIYQFTKNHPIDMSDEKPSERLKKLSYGCKIYNNIYYCLHRTENLKFIFDFANKKLKELNLLETFFVYATFINGKHKLLPVLLNVREFIPDSGGLKLPPIHELMSDSKFRLKYERLLDFCAEFLSKKEDIDVKTARELIENKIMQAVSNSKKASSSFPTKIMKNLTLRNPPLAGFLRKMHFIFLNWKNVLFNNYFTLREYDDKEIEEIKRIEHFIKKYNI